MREAVTRPVIGPVRGLVGVVAVAALARIALLASGSVSFHADEAVIGLMARHITQGARPVFFYGQAYMGSLDAWMVAAGFRLLGESVLVIRLVQSALYLLAVALGYVVAWRVSGRMTVAGVAGLLLAVPPVVGALYTTATLGGYNETLIIGALILLLGYEVTRPGADVSADSRADVGRWRTIARWALLGVGAGVGFWANALIAAYLLPVGLLGLYRFERRLIPMYLLAAAGFIVGSAPWWTFDFAHDHAALATFIKSRQTGEFAGIGLPTIPPGERALGMVFLGWPTLVGLRFPWSGSYFLVPVGLPVLLIAFAAIWVLLRGKNPLKPDARGLMTGMVGVFMVLFVASHFGADPTGRYFVPLLLPLAIILGALAETLRQRFGLRAAVALTVLLVGYQAAGQIAAAASDSGFTTQFDPISHIANDHDDELIDFLDAQGIRHGYTNYWVAYRLAFLTGERMQFSAALPYKEDMSYNAADNRYKPYAAATERALQQAEPLAYITTKLPELDDRLVAWFAAQAMTYRVTEIGEFRVYSEFSAPVAPPAFGDGEG